MLSFFFFWLKMILREKSRPKNGGWFFSPLIQKFHQTHFWCMVNRSSVCSEVSGSIEVRNKNINRTQEKPRPPKSIGYFLDISSKYCCYLKCITKWDSGPGTFNLVTKILVTEFSPEMCFSEFLLFFYQHWKDEARIKWQHTEEQKVIGNQFLNYFVDAKVIDESEQTSFKRNFSGRLWQNK